eukprot:993279-Pyramimonas_sp.AAC.1
MKGTGPGCRFGQLVVDVVAPPPRRRPPVAPLPFASRALLCITSRCLASHCLHCFALLPRAASY